MNESCKRLTRAYKQMVSLKYLSKAYESAEKKIDLNDETKIILFSDLHRGVGDWSDDFAHNEQVFSYALEYYFKEGYTYIEIGDGDELWENKKFEDIKTEYYDIFKLMSKFFENKKLHLIWGNHNRYWEKDENVQRELNYFFPGIKKFDEGIKLGDKIFIVHGHQVQFSCNNLIGRAISERVVRRIWKPLQNVLGFKDPTSPAKNFSKRSGVEKDIFCWAKENHLLVIAGHTHRPMFYSLSKEDKIHKKEKNPYYFNAGSCIHPKCITGIEIEGGEIRLIKWFIDVNKENGQLFVDKKILAKKNIQKVLVQIKSNEDKVF